MTKVIFTVGLIASGKSTWAKQFVKDNQAYKRISRDDLRHMISSYTFDNTNEEIVTKLERDMMLSLVQQGYNLVIDKQNLSDKYLKSDRMYLNAICENGVEFEYKEFPITLSEAIERDSKREFQIGKQVIRQAWNRNEIKLKQMIERHKPKYEMQDNLPYAVICDLDGTLSNSVDRKIFYFKACIDDKVIMPVFDILNKYQGHAISIIFLSGRDEICRDETRKWLDNLGFKSCQLHMRKEKDNRSDVIVKEELYNEFIKDKYNIIFAIDDRPRIVELWCKFGIFTLNVNQDPMCNNNF